MQTISWLDLSWCIIPIVIIGVIFHLWNSSVRELLIASSRMVIQLIAVGYLLILIFAEPSLWVSLAVTAVMFLAATFISIRPIKQHKNIFLAAGAALIISVSFHLVLSLHFVLNIDPWYSPQILIPLAGMYFANTMTSLSLAAERYFSERSQGLSTEAAREVGFRTAMIPQINGLLAVGLVSLPGMMTGQILSGVSPLIAVRYQIMIMTMLLGTCGLGCYIFLSLLQKNKND